MGEPAPQPDHAGSAQTAGGHRTKSERCLHMPTTFCGFVSRADRIRTCDLFVPNEARYQPALQLDVMDDAADFTQIVPYCKPKMLFFCLAATFCRDLYGMKGGRKPPIAENNRGPEISVTGVTCGEMGDYSLSRDLYLACMAASDAAFSFTFSSARRALLEMSGSESSRSLLSHSTTHS